MELNITKFSDILAENLFYTSSGIEKIASGYKFSEGPVWDVAGDCLYFTDFQEHKIFKWTEADGVKLFRENSGRAIGLHITADGRLVAAESGNHAVAYTGDSASEVITDNFEGMKLSSPNDLVVTKNGDVCFTDPYSTAMGKPREIDFNGVYRVTPGGETKLLYGEMERPNGLAFSPLEDVFYVNDTDLHHIIAFDVRSDGSVSKRGVFAKTDPSYGSGAPDGMKTDVLGNVYVTGPGGIWVFAPDSEPIAILHMPELTGNFCFGGRYGDTLYVTASTSVYSVRVKTGGVMPYRNDI